jgi:hypothetical protein
MARHDEVLTQHDMPFVFDLMMGTLGIQAPGHGAQQEEEVTNWSGDPEAANTTNTVSPEDLSGISYTQVAHGHDCAQRVCHDSSLRLTIMMI